VPFEFVLARQHKLKRHEREPVAHRAIDQDVGVATWFSSARS